MGGFTSRHLDALFEALPTTDDAPQCSSSTPSEKNRSRLLSTDPRSPTNYIQRTPIQIERTPSYPNRYVKIGSAESESPVVPSQADSESDPFTDDDCKENDHPAAQTVRPKKLSFTEEVTQRRVLYSAASGPSSPALVLRRKQIQSVTEEMLNADNGSRQVPA